MPSQGRNRRAAEEARLRHTSLRIDDLGGRGDGVGRLASGEVVFVPGTAPGDRVEVALSGRRGGVLRGVVLALEAGDARVDPPCALAERCGGCSWQHVDVAAQRRVKASIAARALAPFLGGDEVQSAGAAPALGWRRRARLHARTGVAGVQLGLLAARSDALVDVDHCPTLTPALNAVLPALRRGLDGAVTRAEVALTEGVQGVVAEVVGVGGAISDAGWAELCAVFVGLRVELSGAFRAHGLREVTLPERRLPYAVTTTASGFAQASAAANEAIVAATRAGLAALAADAPALVGYEAYAGSGNLTSTLIERCARVTTIEADAAACGRARASHRDAIAAGVLDVRHGDADREPAPAVDDALWLLDPGRPGAAGLVAQLSARRPRGLVYVSCAPDTLRRDAVTIAAAGYALRFAAWIDSMPMTPHLELVTAWARVEGAAPARDATRGGAADHVGDPLDDIPTR